VVSSPGLRGVGLSGSAGAVPLVLADGGFAVAGRLISWRTSGLLVTIPAAKRERVNDHDVDGPG
jgi:hypothetical protein